LNSLLDLDRELEHAKETDALIFRRVERLVPAVIRLAVAAGLDSDESPRPERSQLVEALHANAAFDRAAFVKALAAYRGALTRLPPER
jgi:hypothetical protein